MNQRRDSAWILGAEDYEGWPYAQMMTAARQRQQQAAVITAIQQMQMGQEEVLPFDSAPVITIPDLLGCGKRLK